MSRGISLKSMGGGTRALCAAVTIVAAVAALSYVVISKSPAAGNQVAAVTPDNEAPMCGHHALLRTAQILGVSETMDEIMAVMPSRTDGHSFSDLASALNKMGMQSEGSKATLDELAAQPFPLIAHMSPEHWVVVSGINDHYVFIYDGEGRRQTVERDKFDSEWSHRALRVWRDKSVLAKADHEDGPRACFNTLLIDVGEISNDASSAEYRYPVINTGNQPLTIDSVTTDCTCLSHSKPEEPIPPGGTGEIVLSFKVKPQGGPFEREAVVQTNDATTPVIKLTAAGNTSDRLAFNPTMIGLGDLNSGQPSPIKQYILLDSHRDAPWSVESVTWSGTGLELLSTRVLQRKDQSGKHVPGDVQVFGNVKTRVVEVTLQTLPDGEGSIEGSIDIFTTIAGAEHVNIPVSGRYVEPVQVFPGVLYLGEMQPGQHVDKKLIIASRDANPLTIQSVDTGDTGFVCGYDSSPARSQTLMFSGDIAHPNYRAGTIRVVVKHDNKSTPITLGVPVYKGISP